MKRNLIILSCLGISTISFGQSLTNLKFSTPMLTNPALTGTSNTPQLNISSSALFNGYNTAYLDYSQYSKKLHGGIGVYTNNTFFNFSNGENENRNVLGFSYAYQNNINEKWHYSLGTALEIGNFGWSENNETKNYAEVGAKVGGLIFTESFFFSASYERRQLLKANLIDNYKFQFDLGYKIKPFKSLDLSFTPSVGYVNRFGNGSLNANLEAQFKRLHVGYGIENGRPNASIGYDFDRFRINYNIENFGNLSDFPKHSLHQLSFRFKFKSKPKNSNSTNFNMNLF